MGDAASDIIDGFYLDDNATKLDLTGSIGLEADAYIVSLTGGLSLTLDLSLKGTGGKTRLSTFNGNFSLGNVFNLGGEIDLGFTINVGLELGFIHVTLFTVNIGPFVIVSFEPPSPQPLSTPPTIYINETNTSEDIHVEQLTFPDPNIPGQTDSAIEVVYPTYNEIYMTGASNANGPISPNPYPTYKQIVTRVVDTPIVTPLLTLYEPEPIVQPQSITIAPDVTSYDAQGQPMPINAVLIGGAGDDDLEYDASGQAVLIGAGGNNTLGAGGKAGSVIEYGDTIDPDVASPLSGSDVPAWINSLPTDVRQELAQELSVATDTTTNDTFAGTGGADFFEGGAGSNNFQESGNNFTLMALGQVANVFEYTTPTGSNSGSESSTPGQIYFGNNPNAENIIGLQPAGKNNLTLLPVISPAGNYLQIKGNETNLDAYGDIQNVSVALDGGTMQVGDLSAFPSLTSMFITEDTGTVPANLPASGANTITFDQPSSGASSKLDLNSIYSVEQNVVSEPGLVPPNLVAPPSFYDMEAQEAETNDHVIFQGLTAADTVRFNMNGGTVNVSNIDELGPQSVVIDGSDRGASGDPSGIAVNITGPYIATRPDINHVYGSPLTSTLPVFTNAAGDPEIMSGPYQGQSGQLAVHGSIPADIINLNVPVELSSWGGGFAQPPSATTQVPLDASAFAGTVNVNAVAAAFTLGASGAWYFTNTVVNISAVSATGSVAVTGLDHGNFPYPDAIDAGNTGQAIVTVGAGLLSRIEGNVTANNAQLTVDNSESTDADILTMTATSLTGWIVPAGVAPPTLFWTPVLYNNMVVKAGNEEDIDVEGMPTIEVLTYTGDPYSTFEGYSSVAFENTATSTTPDSVYVMATNPADNLSLGGDYSLYVGQRLNPDGTVTEVDKVDGIVSPIILDYTGTGGNANVVFDAANDTYKLGGQLFYDYLPFLVTPPGETTLSGVFPTIIYGGIVFNASHINFTFDSTICPGSILDGGDTLYITNPGTDTVTYNATAITGSTPIANHVIIENSGAPIVINGNGNTQVSFVEDLTNDFNLYSGIQANVDINDADIDVEENYDAAELPDLSDIVLTGGSLTGATIGAIDFIDPTGFSYEETSPVASGITMTVANTPAGFTTALSISGTDLTILATTGPLDVNGYQGYNAESFVTVGNGTLQGIDGEVVIRGQSSGVNGFVTTLDDRNDSPHSNVVIADTIVPETITGLAPATIGFDANGYLNLEGSAGSTCTVDISAGSFNLDAGAGSTVNLDPGPFAIESLTVIGAAQVNVGQGDLSRFNNDTIEASPNDPNAPIAVTINATEDSGAWGFLLGDGAPGLDSFEFYHINPVYQTINLQRNTVQLTLQLPTSGTTSPGLTVDDTGTFATTIDEGNVPTTVAGTTGPLLLASNAPGEISIGSAGSVQGINGEVDVVSPDLGQPAASLVVDDSADPSARSILLAAAAGGLYSITGLAPAPVDFTGAEYKLTLDAGTAGNVIVIQDVAAGAVVIVNSGAGDDAIDAEVSGTGGFAPLTINGGAGTNNLTVAGSGDNPVISNLPTAGMPGAGEVQASYSPSGPTRTINYTGIGSILGITPPTIYTVTDDSGSVSDTGSLAYMVAQANANTNPVGSEIEFDPGVFSASSPRTIELLLPLVLNEIAGPEMIEGFGAGVVIGTAASSPSAAIDVTQGSVVITGVTFITATDTPTILVSGGSLTLRDDVIEESTGFTDAAISLTGGGSTWERPPARAATRSTSMARANSSTTPRAMVCRRSAIPSRSTVPQCRSPI